MASIDITTQSGAVGNGDLQLQNGAPMDGTLRFVTDAVNTASPLKLSTSLVQTTSTLKITTNDNPYIDAEDGAGNNRFTVGRDTGSQQVNVDFASNPSGSTTIVGAIRTYVDGVTLSEVMAFREDGNIGINTLTPGAKLDIHSASNVIMQLNRTGAGKSWLQYLQAGTARWNTGYDNTNGNFTIYDAVNAADRMVVTNAGNVGIGTITPGTSLGGAYGLVLNSGAASDNQIRLQNNTTGSNSTDGGLLSISGSLLYLWNYEASDTIFGTNSAERMRITSTGNVGIGTSTPNSKLEISAGVDIYGENITSSSGVATTTGISMGSFVGNPGGSNGSVYIASSHNHGATAQSSMVLYTHNGSALTEKMRIDPTGNVGIGTTTPSEKLVVTDGSILTQGIGGGGAFNILQPITPNTDARTWAMGASVAAFGDFGIKQSNAKDGDPITAGDTKFYISRFGNVGIGTTSPAAKLDVVSTLNVQAINNSDLPYINFSNSGASFNWGRVGGLLTGAGDGSLYFQTKTGASLTDKMQLTDTGYLRMASGTGGIQFNGDTAAANALDDYEEGTWTMGISFGGSSVGIGYNANTGRYTKIGNQVTLSGYIALNSKGSSTGVTYITGLPFTIGSGLTNFAASSFWFNAVTSTGQFQGYSEPATSTIKIDQISSVGVNAAVTDANFANNTELMINITYFV